MFSANASQQADDKLYVDDVFSTTLYTGNGSTQTITTGIDLVDAAGGRVYFDGINDYLSVSDNAALELSSSSFTVEAWVYMTANAPTNGACVISKSGTNSIGPFAIIVEPVTNYLIGYGSTNGSSWGIGAFSTTVVVQNRWNHVAWVRSGSTFTLYLNGVSVATASNAGALVDNGESVKIGWCNYVSTYFKGYISNLRIVAGTAIYTGAFSPPRTTLTAVSGTALLCCQLPNQTLDYSSNNFTVTFNNGPTTDTTDGPLAAPGKGGMVWVKNRLTAATNNFVWDTARTIGSYDPYLQTNSTSQQLSPDADFLSYLSSGFQWNAGSGTGYNGSGESYVSWTFRKAAKFFDVVTYTGDGVAGRTVAHSLGTTPGMIIVKCTSSAAGWAVYHRSIGNTGYVLLNDTGATTTLTTAWNDTSPTSSVFSVGTAGVVNANGSTYVAYIFAHDTATDGLIQCGSYTGNGNAAAGPIVTLGWEPQYVLIKRATGAAAGWCIFDSMRGMVIGNGDKLLSANWSDADITVDKIDPKATGFQVFSGDDVNANGDTYIYLAIRRPNKPPTSGTQVYSSSYSTASTGSITSGFPTDLLVSTDRSAGGTPWARLWQTRLLGAFNFLTSLGTDAEANNTSTASFDVQNGVKLNGGGVYPSGYDHYQFRRAPGVFDVVCYDGTSGANQTISHGLGAVPEFLIFKKRSAVLAWRTFCKYNSYIEGTAASNYCDLPLDQTVINGSGYSESETFAAWPTASSFTVKDAGDLSGNGATYVVYLFATLAGVSKVGSYTGNGSSQTINCGFAAGARFVLIRRVTGATGDWYVWDSVRGIVAGNDPHKSLNQNVADVSTDDSIDPDNSGFIVNQLAATNINVTSSNYIFLAFA
jgi:hypothetical protein